MNNYDDHGAAECEASRDTERLNWLAYIHGRIEYDDERRAWWVEFLDPNASGDVLICGPEVLHDFRLAIDAAREMVA